MNRRARWDVRLVVFSVFLFLAVPTFPQSNLPGDANCDGQVDAKDVAAEIDAIFGVPTDCPNVDTDGDGRPTAADLVSIIQAQGLPAPSTMTATATITPTSTETPSAPPTTAAATLTPTSGSVTSPTIVSVTFAEVQTEVFDSDVPPGTGCTNVGCHSGQFPQANLSLEAGKSYDNLVNKIPFTTSAKNRGLVLVAPRDLNNSFLWLKVTGNLDRFDGAQMPSGGSPLSQQKLDLLMAWILEGAPQ
jgi:Dockerin type I domain